LVIVRRARSFICWAFVIMDGILPLSFEVPD
jgi:hypothetical protein